MTDLTDETLREIEERAEKATAGPWCWESCGEKGDGPHMIGVAFGPDDVNAERPLSGRLETWDRDDNEIVYYRDELVAECAHRNRQPDADADFITHAREDIPRLCAALRAEREKNRELAREAAQWRYVRDRYA